MHWKELSLIRRLKEHDEEKDEFISVTAHELRHSIMPILFVIDNLRDELGDREEIDRLLHNTKRLQLLTRNLLEAPRIDNHDVRLDRADFDLQSVISEAIEDAKAYMAEKNLCITYNQEPLPQLMPTGAE